MITQLARVTILVRDQDEALRFYTEKLGFEKRADVAFGPAMRWLTVAPRGQQGVEIVLQKPEPAMHGEEDARRMLEVVGRNPTWVFACDDCRATYAELRGRGVEFSGEPQEQPYGVEAVFVDLYGNSFSLLQPAQAAQRPDQAPAADAVDKATLIEHFRSAGEELRAAVAQVGEARMEEPGASGDWSAKDVLAHVAVYKDWLAVQLTRAARGEPPDRAEIERDREAGLFDTDVRNNYYYERDKDRPLGEVRTWAAASHARLMDALAAIPEPILARPGWWTGDRPLGQMLDPGHDAEHAAAIRAWLARA